MIWTMQRPGKAGAAGATGPEVEMVLVLIRTFFVLLRSYVVDSLCYGGRRLIEFVSCTEGSDRHVTLDLVVQDMYAKETTEFVVGKLERYTHQFLVSKVTDQSAQIGPGTQQRKQYLGMVLDSVRALVFPLPERACQCLSVAQNFLEDRAPMVFLWRSLLGHLAPLEKLVLGGQLPLYVSPLLDLRVWKEDVFAFPWEDLDLYTFSPFSLIRWVLV
ncbi:hypothetical protein E2C01_042518 [Portunus trituberculatus]|uniref:Uncharacterized protein n=1 Tax=Portunus trituberculatus TaxID=210409 RepID=A0A5B7FTV0_PORTR|nr:hypothetical protein [Portunus trituberculatus]